MDHVIFKVGNYIHACTKEDLLKVENSVLAKYVAPEWDKRKNVDEPIFIERDGQHFWAILRYIKDNESLNLDIWPSGEIGKLKEEADYYGITGLMEICDKASAKRQMDSKLSKNLFLDNSEHEKISEGGILLFYNLYVARDIDINIFQPEKIEKLCKPLRLLYTYYSNHILMSLHHKGKVIMGVKLDLSKHHDSKDILCQILKLINEALSIKLKTFNLD